MSTSLVRFEERMFDMNRKLEEKIKTVRDEMIPNQKDDIIRKLEEKIKTVRDEMIQVQKDDMETVRNFDQCMIKTTFILLVLICMLLGFIAYILLNEDNLFSAYVKQMRG